MLAQADNVPSVAPASQLRRRRGIWNPQLSPPLLLAFSQCSYTVILPLIHTHVFCLSPIDFHPSSLQNISPALEFLFYLLLALAAALIICSRSLCHRQTAWSMSFLSDLIRHPIHEREREREPLHLLSMFTTVTLAIGYYNHHCKQTRAQSRSLIAAPKASPRTPPSLLPHTSPLLYCRHTYLVLFSRRPILLCQSRLDNEKTNGYLSWTDRLKTINCPN